MQNCLGIYIDNNLIKYAKVIRERDSFKLESYGIKFFDNVEEAIEQIIGETNSHKVPICTNLLDTQYAYIDMFSLLNKKDLEKASNTEFELYCNDTGINKAAIEYRTLMVPNLKDKDKTTTVYAYTNKSSIVTILKNFKDYNLASICPTGLAIYTLNGFFDKKNSIIINIEDKTTVTTIVDGEVHKVDIIDNGMEKILNSISARENSKQKAYEICKNATIYTANSIPTQVTENEYMQYIMPTLYSIVEETKDILAKNQVDISNIYITGLATAINNIDLYFQENFVDKKCEILTPFFSGEANSRLNIKDYIEVNSAIALALNNLIPAKKLVDFKGASIKNKLAGKVQIISTSKKNSNNANKENTKKQGGFIKMDLGTSLDFLEKTMIRTIVGLIILMISYSVISKVTSNKIRDKQKEVEIVIQDTQEKIKNTNNTITKVNSKASEYESFIRKIEEANSKLSEYYASKNSIPILLNSLQAVIPDGVQLLLVDNTSNKHIQIKAQAEKYEQLGFFIAKLKTDGILVNITSDSGTKTDNVIQITIEGDLPY